jgi:hypothetical protein
MGHGSYRRIENQETHFSFLELGIVVMILAICVMNDKD